MNDDDAGTRWLVLVYQFPKGPGSLRVKMWRRLQCIGAVAIKHSVYVLPLNEQSQEDFQWLLAELVDGGADGAIMESRFVDGMSDQQVRALFDQARQADYAALHDEIRSDLSALAPDADADAQKILVRAQKRLSEIEAIDFFGADGQQAVETAIRELGERLSTEADITSKGGSNMAMSGPASLRNRVWVTRRNVRVDRIASAWLIRRFIDRDAAFKFVTAKSYRPADDEVRFDMFEGEFTHEGDSCTFEVLARHVRPQDAALRSVAEIVHDIDLKDAKFGRPETQGIANLLSGVVLGVDDDTSRIERGGAIFEDLYRFFDGASA